MSKASRYILKHSQKTQKPFVQSVKVDCTGLDVSYADEGKALQFETKAVAIVVSHSLRPIGHFFLVEVDG